MSIQKTKRPPVVAIMGHVDHGKSTLLDTIRKTNVVDGEAGGITQHISAYEAYHKGESGIKETITFIDTPGHAAFTDMRKRGANMADIAILIVSAEESVKPQTAEAIKIIKDYKVPFLVAINKIDRPNANPEKVKQDLMNHEVFVEGYGGDVSYVEISAKTGQGVEELLDTILLVAELEEFTGDPERPAEGFVVESHHDTSKGLSATLIIKDGTIRKGDYVVAGTSVASTRILEDFTGKKITKSATFSSPIKICGFSSLPQTGSLFVASENKKEAEETASLCILNTEEEKKVLTEISATETRAIIPIIVKTDVAGTKEAIISSLSKIESDKFVLKIVKAGVGPINESDFQTALTSKHSIIAAFHVGVDPRIQETLRSHNVSHKSFEIIYHLLDWVEEQAEKLRPKNQFHTILGEGKVLKTFSSKKGEHLIGLRMTEGEISIKDRIKVNREEEIFYGHIVSIQQAKSTKTVLRDGEAGVIVHMKSTLPEEGDIIKSFIVETD